MVLQVITSVFAVMAVGFTYELYKLLFTTKDEPATEETPTPRNVLYGGTLISIIILVASLKLEEMFAETLILGKPSSIGANWMFRLIAIMQLIAHISTLGAILLISELSPDRDTDKEGPVAEKSSNMQGRRTTTRTDWLVIATYSITAMINLVWEEVFAGDLILGKLTPTGVKWTFRLLMGLQLLGGLGASAAVLLVVCFFFCISEDTPIKHNQPQGIVPVTRASNAEQV